jgi:hypothetical protein
MSKNGLRRSHEDSEALKEVGQVVKKRFSLKMKKERFRTCKAAEAMAAAIL